MYLSRKLFKLSNHFEYYSKIQPTPVTLKSLIDFAADADIKYSYKYLRVELLVRWSHMRKEMDYIPTRLLEMPSFKLANSLYDQSFSEVLAFKDAEPNATTLRQFTETLVGIRRRHANIVPTLARAYMELEKSGPIDLIEKNRLQYFYDRFFMNRIGVRTLIYQHTLLFGNELPEHPQQAGIIDPYCDVASIVRDAYATAKKLFERASYPVPNIEISSHNAHDNEKNHVTIVYIPSHLYHIVFELLKNSLRATVERYGFDAKEYPPVCILIVKGHEDLTIQISDLGGGVPRSKISQLFHYMYSTAPKPQADFSLDTKKTPIAGLGYGLPIARLYAKYFQGNLALSSVEGLGTWAYISIKATAESASELLPIFSKLRYSYTTKKDENENDPNLLGLNIIMFLTRFLRSQHQSLAHLVDHYAQYPPTGLTMKRIVEFAREGDAQQSFLFLRNELPVRLASMMKEMGHLPPRLLEMPSVKTVNGWYGTSLRELHSFKGSQPTKEIVRKFTKVLQNIRIRHTSVVETLAQGYMEFSDLGRVKEYEESQIQYFLNRFYLSRISIRLLIYQHTMCFGEEVPIHPTHLGFVDPNCYVEDTIRHAFENAQFLCEGYYLTAPSLEVRSINAINPDEPIEIAYVPSHLYHVMFELFKNAMRATVEYSESKKSNKSLPPIIVDIVKAKEDLTIRISDRGGGIPRSRADKIFRYMYSTAPRPVSLNDAQHSGPVPLAGFGYGLPISRLYARYFNGDMEIHSIDGYGTDAYIYLQAVEEQASEWLPICNRAAYEYYISRRYQSDWTKKH